MAASTGVRAQPSRRMSRRFPWLVFTLTFALMLSDYMSRQVLAAVFPYLKADWGLSDTALAGLTSIVSLMVGLLAVPLSLLGDRWGRARAIVAMAFVWSAATVVSALASSYGQLFAARAAIGIGEAAYASVGLAVVLSVFSPARRAVLAGTFTAGGSFGSVLGVALGGAFAAQFGWRWAFAAMGLAGLVLAIMYAMLITDRGLGAHRVPEADTGPPRGARPHRAGLGTLFSTPSVVLAYVANGAQLFVAASLVVWLPSYLNRAHHMTPPRAASVAALLILVLGAGMIGCGLITDRVRRHRPIRQWSAAIVFSALSLVLLSISFAMPPGGAQLPVLAAGCFFAAGTTGPTGVMVARLTHESVRATAFGMLTMFTNVLGLAAGPFVTGILADRFGLATALRCVPLAALLAMIALLIGRQAYPASVRKLDGRGAVGFTGPAPTVGAELAP
ncbi:MFS transporter [Krasilnikovia sp. MM14-A1259]|uniref:MFS transporter n=1 Tax=Krasilnikovia sp. MM14-A1259 TaxID=3373539 RepID=UPI003805DC49